METPNNIGIEYTLFYAQRAIYAQKHNKLEFQSKRNKNFVQRKSKIEKTKQNENLIFRNVKVKI